VRVPKFSANLEATATLKESKLSGAQGQYFFWEPVNNDIPEIGLSQL
jgi:hypothetical protein